MEKAIVLVPEWKQWRIENELDIFNWTEDQRPQIQPNLKFQFTLKIATNPKALMGIAYVLIGSQNTEQSTLKIEPSKFKAKIMMQPVRKSKQQHFETCILIRFIFFFLFLVIDLVTNEWKKKRNTKLQAENIDWTCRRSTVE